MSRRHPFGQEYVEFMPVDRTLHRGLDQVVVEVEILGIGPDRKTGCCVREVGKLTKPGRPAQPLGNQIPDLIEGWCRSVGPPIEPAQADDQMVEGTAEFVCICLAEEFHGAPFLRLA
jgi:hypothetical protein